MEERYTITPKGIAFIEFKTKHLEWNFDEALEEFNKIWNEGSD
jgi:hypothetical protein